MVTLRKAFRNHKFSQETGTFGIEIETEVLDQVSYKDFFSGPPVSLPKGIHEYPNKTKYWSTVTDGSLRNFGIEFVLRKPLNIMKAISALEEFEEVAKKVPFLQKAPATSVHVHVNMIDEELLTIVNYITMWVFFENILLDFCGPSRRSNLFALGVKNAEYALTNILTLFDGLDKGARQAIKFQESHVKYAALNLATLSKYGSLELRCFRGTTDSGEIIPWIMILNKILEYARTPGLTPSSFLSAYKTVGSEIMNDVFGSYTSMLRTDATEAHIERNLGYLMLMADSVEDWGTIGIQYDIADKKAKLDDFIQYNVAPGVVFNALAEQSANIEWTTIDDLSEEDNF